MNKYKFKNIFFQTQEVPSKETYTPIYKIKTWSNEMIHWLKGFAINPEDTSTLLWYPYGIKREQTSKRHPLSSTKHAC